MITREITKAEALTLSKRDESHFFDKKAAKVSGKQAQKISVAFANADGDELFIGIADSKDEPDPEKRWQGAIITAAIKAPNMDPELKPAQASDKQLPV